MIDDTIGKILGMAMAYGVSSLGLFLAYVNYRKRTIKAEKVMTTTAWMVIAAVLLAVAGGVFVVSQLAQPPADGEAVAEAAVAEAAVAEEPDQLPAPTRDANEERNAWPIIGIVLPASIFFFATWVTTALHRHFTRDHPGPSAGDG